MTDQEVINAISKGGESEVRAMDFVYKTCVGKISGYLLGKVIDKNRPKREEEAHDLAVDAMVAMRMNILRESLSSFNSAKMDTYLISIARYQYMNKVRKEKRSRGTEWLIPPEEPVDEELLLRMRTCLRQLGDKCRELVRLYYFQQLPMKDAIQLTAYTYTNPEAGRAALYHCRKRLKKKMNEYSGTK